MEAKNEIPSKFLNLQFIYSSYFGSLTYKLKAIVYEINKNNNRKKHILLFHIIHFCNFYVF